MALTPRNEIGERKQGPPTQGGFGGFPAPLLLLGAITGLAAGAAGEQQMPPGLTVHGKDPRPAGTDGNLGAGATAVLARALDAKLGGRKGCNTAASRSDEGAGNALRSPDDRSKKIQIPWLGAGPRAAGHQMRTAGPALTEDRSELPLLAGLQRAWTDTSASGPGDSLDR